MTLQDTGVKNLPWAAFLHRIGGEGKGGWLEDVQDLMTMEPRDIALDDGLKVTCHPVKRNIALNFLLRFYIQAF